MIDHKTNTTPLVPDPPRAVPGWFFLRRMRAMAFCGALFTGLGVVLGVGLPALFYLLGGRISPVVDWDLDRKHASATAVITDKRFIPHTQVGFRHPWRVAFQFATPEGTAVATTGHTYDPSFENKTVGDPIEVEYDPADPSRARPVGGSAALLPLRSFLMIIASVGSGALAGVLVLIVTGFRARSERFLLVYGVGAEGQVIHVREVRSVRFGWRSPYDVHYTFTEHRGLEVEGRDRTYHYVWAGELKPGDKVGVVYNPRSPEANVLWLHGDDVPSEA